MSNAAISWALGCRCGSSSAKAVLLVMANAARDKETRSLTGQLWPPLHAWMSQAALAEYTELDRKTIGPALARLESLGFIARAGSEGNTRQIPVYLLRAKVPENGALDEAQKDPESGSVSGAQAATESIPVSDAKDPVFPGEGSRFSRESTPKTGHGDLLNLEGTQKETKKKTRRRASDFDAATVALPEWLDRELWASWVADRKDRGKEITERAAKLQLAQLGRFREEGHSPQSVIENSIVGGWTGLFAPKGGQIADSRDVLPGWRVAELERIKKASAAVFPAESEDLLRRHYAATRRASAVAQRQLDITLIGDEAETYREGITDDGRIL